MWPTNWRILFEWVRRCLGAPLHKWVDCACPWHTLTTYVLDASQSNQQSSDELQFHSCSSSVESRMSQVCLDVDYQANFPPNHISCELALLLSFFYTFISNCIMLWWLVTTSCLELFWLALWHYSFRCLYVAIDIQSELNWVSTVCLFSIY